MALLRPIRVAFCLDSFAIGGTELNAVRTAEALDRGRIELSVIHLQTHGPLRARYAHLGVPMTHLPIPNLYSPRTAAQGVSLAKQLRFENVDVVHAHDIYCNIFAAPWVRILTRCSMITSRRWWYDAPRPGLVKINRFSSSFAHCVLANSGGVAELLAREEHVPRRKIAEIPNFLAASAFDSVDALARIAQRRVWGLPDRVFAVGIVARLSPVKNHMLLLQAMAQLDDRFHLVIIGDGPSRVELEAIARNLQIETRVHFVGEVISTQNLHQYFDVSVLCSLSEGFPNSVIEAMAASRAVIATPVGGMADVVTDAVTGLLVPVNDPAPLAAALRTLEADAPLRARLGEAGCATVKSNFSQANVIEKLSLLYESLASRPQSTTAEHERA